MNFDIKVPSRSKVSSWYAAISDGEITHIRGKHTGLVCNDYPCEEN